MVCSLELPSLPLHAGAHDLTAVLRRDESVLFVASTAILLRPAPPVQQQPALFASPLYRADVPQPPLALVPHVRALASADVDAADADNEGSGDVNFMDESGRDSDGAARSLLQGDPISGGGMKVCTLNGML